MPVPDWLVFLVIAFFSLCMAGYAAFVLRCAWFFYHIPCLSPEKAQPLPMVSVIVPARNEAAGIRACLTALCAQHYPRERMEVIAVNDHSSDDTWEIIQAMGGEYPHLRAINLNAHDTVAYKKAALQAGIRAARGEIILQTDADGIAGPAWVATMVAHFTPETGLVAGPVWLDHQGTHLERLQSVEYMGLALIAGGSIQGGRPNMCNGANMGFRKALFEAVGGYAGIDHLASGDDELLMHKVHRSGLAQIRYAKCRKAIVRSRALPNWKALKAQRLRWVSKARHYQHRQVNAAQVQAYLAFLGIPLTFLLSLGRPELLPFPLLLTAVKIGVEGVTMYLAARFFHKLPLLPLAFLYQPLYLAYVLWVGVAGSLTTRYEWKGRTVS